jgi:hypothetical protein
MAQIYNGQFYVFFDEKKEDYLIFHWDSSTGLIPDFKDTNYEKIGAIIANVAAKTDFGGTVAYSPIGPFLEFNVSDPRVIYLALLLTYPDALSIRYDGSLENREEWEEFTSAMEAGPVDKDGFPVVR